jgi:NADH dehydrogenase [ubiquinone] 1 alpha subcomplex assembly factor 6
LAIRLDVTDSLTYCGRFVKENDPDRFFLSLLADRPADIWPLLAFNCEIAKTREIVTDTTIGLIRLQWWRDSLDKIYDEGTVLQHEVVTELARLIKTYDLPRDLFENLLYAREFDLEDVLPATLEGLVNYADYTHTPLLSLILKVMRSEEDVKFLAISYTLTGLLRSVLYHARQHRCYLPQDVLADHGVDMGLFYDMKPQGNLNPVVITLASTAKRYLAASAPRTAYTRGMKKMTLLYLKKMAACDYNVFNKSWITPPAFKEVRVTFAAKIFQTD